MLLSPMQSIISYWVGMYILQLLSNVCSLKFHEESPHVWKYKKEKVYYNSLNYYNSQIYFHVIINKCYCLEILGLVFFSFLLNTQFLANMLQNVIRGAM